MLGVMNGLAKIVEPSVKGFFVLESDHNLVLVRTFENDFEVEIGLIHKPTELLDFYNFFNLLQIVFLLTTFFL